ncbi:hypothetical protein F53441_1646 [Fusarium austroafricanum]|uniref:Uncharacterized protein n=1 Tax=Fusarium austroafricanum TaxID=2364996 RepID=A0A8H4KTX8_9HYPO|nr:hypothetical protein F53441_1646 [Fusarium austroafricanum]
MEVCCNSQNTHDMDGGPKPAPVTPEPKPECNGRHCTVKMDNIFEMFPTLTVLPRPEPFAEDSSNHDHWLKDFDQWGSLRCQCGRGYFCREHGDWISGDEVGSGAAITGDKQRRGHCPSYHYSGEKPSMFLEYTANKIQGYADRDSYVGQRDGSQYEAT